MRIAGLLLAVMSLSAAAQAQQTLTLEIRDFATMPITGVPLGKTTNEMLLSRVNAIREEPGGAPRLFRSTSSTRKPNSSRSIWTSTGATTGPASSIGFSLRAAMATASTGSISIPTTGAPASSTLCTWKTRT